MDDVELIKQKIDIVDLIQEYLPLKKAGINFKTVCPFHSEKTPSFMVSPERGIWRCFGCQKGGDIFAFVMEKEGLEFKDALELLAKKAGVVLKRTPQKKDYKERLYEVNQKAQQFFHYMLLEHPLGKPALEYLLKRGVSKTSVKLFGLGYAPLNWETLVNFLKKRGFSEKEIIDSGLAVPAKTGCYDRFRGRVMFPLVDIKDKILGFSGRILGKGEPKYINSPQTPIFDKGKFLFGINLSKGEIKQKKEAIIVEGEMDMIIPFQESTKNIVASKGTALTEEQIVLIKRYADTILLCFDADFAGDLAARRGIEMADKQGLNIKMIQIDGAKDPAEICMRDVKKWDAVTKEALPVYDYYLDSSSKRNSLKSAIGKKNMFNELVPIISRINDPVVREHYVQKLAAFLQIKEDLIREELKKRQIESFPQTKIGIPKENKDDKIGPQDRRALLEEYAVAILLHFPPVVTYVPTFPETLFTQEILKEIYVMLVLFLDKISYRGKEFKINDFIKTLPQDLVSEVDRIYLMQIDERLENPAYWQKELGLVISELKRMLIRASLEKLSLEIRQAQNLERLESLEVLNKRFRDLSVKLKNI